MKKSNFIVFGAPWYRNEKGSIVLRACSLLCTFVLTFNSIMHAEAEEHKIRTFAMIVVEGRLFLPSFIPLSFSDHLPLALASCRVNWSSKMCSKAFEYRDEVGGLTYLKCIMFS